MARNAGLTNVRQSGKMYAMRKLLVAFTVAVASFTLAGTVAATNPVSGTPSKGDLVREPEKRNPVTVMVDKKNTRSSTHGGTTGGS